MRNLFVSIAAAVIACIISCSCNARDIVIKVQDLPQAAQSFISTHFKGIDVTFVIKDGNEYDVRFANGWELEFNRKGEWKTVDCKHEAVPSSIIALIPESIPAYIQSYFTNAFVTEISKDRREYDIELNNGLDLEFSLNGKLKKVDD